MRSGMVWGVLAGVLLAGCSDSSSKDTGGAGGSPGPRMERDAAPATVDAAPVAPDAAPPAHDAARSADAAPPTPDAAAPECSADGDCGDGRVCQHGACIDGRRCATPDDCDPGNVCIGTLCLPDPQATGGLVADPDALVFTFAQAGDRIQRQTFLTNRGEAPVDITDIHVEGPGVFTIDNPPQPPVRVAPGHQIDLTVNYDADDLVPDQADVVVTTQPGGAMPARVRLASDHKATGGQTPCLRVMPTRLDFGIVVRGMTGHRSFTMESCGNVPVTVAGVRRGVSIFGQLPPQFQLANPPGFPLVLQPGQQQMIDVTYSPRRAGLDGGFWEVASNDPQNPSQHVDVSGLANPPPLEQVELHVRMEWNTDLTDVDLHVLAPNGQMWTCDGDCYFSNPQPNWGDPNQFVDDPFLDVDDVDGFGPENVNIEAPAPGTYRVLAHYWDTHGGNEPDVTIEVLNFGQVVGHYGPVHLSGVDDVWQVVDIDMPSLTLHPLGNNVANQARGGLCGGF
jgi:hypothetical protein